MKNISHIAAPNLWSIKSFKYFHNWVDLFDFAPGPVNGCHRNTEPYSEKFRSEFDKARVIIEIKWPLHGNLMKLHKQKPNRWTKISLFQTRFFEKCTKFLRTPILKNICQTSASGRNVHCSLRFFFFLTNPINALFPHMRYFFKQFINENVHLLKFKINGFD